MIRTSPHRGFTLLIAIILSTVVLTVGLALLDVAYKQVILSSTAKQSQAAFYNADSALECALYYDQKKDSFDFTVTPDFTALKCSNVLVTNGSYNGSDPAVHITKFAIPCVGGGISASTTIYKYTNGATALYADGFNTCTASDPRRVDRGLKASYGDSTVVITPPPPSGNSVTYLVVGGGGGGGGRVGGGGGGGGIKTGTITLASGSYAIAVGTGGAGGIANPSTSLDKGGNGTGSSITGGTTSIITHGGGGGGFSMGSGDRTGSSGGSGGGAGYSASTPMAGGSSYAGEGHDGGAVATPGQGWAAGGGGYSTAGGTGSGSRAGDGGAGLVSTISGSSVTYGSGGGGGPELGYTIQGGFGGSGAGDGNYVGGANSKGTNGRGGGGGGGGYDGDAGFSAPGGPGGSGVVIISYPVGSITGATGGTITTVGGNKIHTFTSNGTFVIP